MVITRLLNLIIILIGVCMLLFGNWLVQYLCPVKALFGVFLMIVGFMNYYRLNELQELKNEEK